MKKLSFVLLLFLFIEISFAHPWDDLGTSWCHSCKTNCADYGLIYWEFHCHKMSLEEEIKAIKSHFSSNWFGRSTAVNDAIEQAELRFADTKPQSSPTYSVPTYIPSTNTSNLLIDSYDKLIEYIKIAGIYYDALDYDNVIITLNKALPYAKNISTEQEEAINNFIKDAYNKKTIKEFTDAFNFCNSIYWSLSYWYKTGWNIICNCVEWYNLDTVDKKCIKSTNLISAELTNAVSWLYTNWLTKYETEKTFMSNSYLTREQASKFFVQFAKKTLWKKVNTKQKVNLNDLKNADGTLQSYIKESNQLWLFKWSNWKFMPFNKLTRAQALAVIIRAKDWVQNEKWDKRYSEYYNKAYNYWILDWLWFEYSTLDLSNITRWEMALLLYRLANNEK